MFADRLRDNHVLSLLPPLHRPNRGYASQASIRDTSEGQAEASATCQSYTVLSYTVLYVQQMLGIANGHPGFRPLLFAGCDKLLVLTLEATQLVWLIRTQRKKNTNTNTNTNEEHGLDA
ncbi:hypothetical protein NUW58_g5057 [Xylaria curta]|uniref:Uncharacterized protein n=1 Tax=Xylaria curta TaxID=42375 RepID=A0ACC1P620_9PEZI|nr:hypothetical protein NUW58_g5057 [Xylaria curta]